MLYYKIKGDYLRYIIENMKDEEKRKKYSNQAFNAYKSAMEAGKTLSWTNEIKLEMMLNFSVYYVDIIGNYSQGIADAKKAVNNLEKELTNVKENDEKFKGVRKIHKMLKENIEMWEIETEEIGKN
jgi:14-3-3 protein epsilon